MSIQSEWKPASKDEPAEFDLDYVEIKVQVIRQTATGDIQVRLATAFKPDWQERQFEEWLADYDYDNSDEVFEALYPMLKVLVKNKSGDDRALLNAAISELETRNSGLIRG